MSRRFRRRPSRAAVAAAVLLALVAARLGQHWTTGDRQAATSGGLREGSCQVVRVVDGDTFIVRQRVEAPWPATLEARVRLLGVDAPETVKPNHPVEPWGPEAAAFAENFLSGGRAWLQFDKRRIDKYDRFLAYVYVDDRMLNEELVRAGLARVSVYPGDSQSIARRLRRAQDEAKQAGRGIWSASHGGNL